MGSMHEHILFTSAVPILASSNQAARRQTLDIGRLNLLLLVLAYAEA